jgi:SpoVK/Ycf46/Vps4 family AAA+-type ATPase
MAQLIEPRTELTFDDLILPRSNKRQLAELRNRIAYRNQLYSGLGFERRLSLGKGLIALFTGSSGTGKTMAAELLAREQGVDLYKIDLSAVVSKYVGETEKNLGRVFADAEDANAILFFDEADALFGKRGEVKDARDRWANMEINYLLQRVEEYSGVVILASNLRQNFDDAFMRRIHVIVEFPFPEPDARLCIWKGMIPPGVGLDDDVDFKLLADQFRFSGGSIRNVVVDAAFRALAEAGGERPAISMRHLVLGIAREYQKFGKPATKGEFSLALYDWVEKEILSA